MDLTLDRRTLLRSGSLAAGAFALGGGVFAQPAKAETQAIPVTGRVIGWLRIDPERCAELRIAELGDNRRELKAVGFEASSVTATTAEAHRLTIAAVARSWGIVPADCVIGHNQIRDPRGGRSVSYAVWVDIA